MAALAGVRSVSYVVRNLAPDHGLEAVMEQGSCARNATFDDAVEFMVRRRGWGVAIGKVSADDLSSEDSLVKRVGAELERIAKEAAP